MARLDGFDGSQPPALRLLSCAALLCCGIVLSGTFVQGAVLSIEVGILLLFALAVLGCLFPAGPRLGLLSRLMVLIYAMPFSVLLGYLVEHDYIWILTPNGMDIIQDRLLVQQMTEVGLIGIIGLIAGYQLAALVCARPLRGVPTQPADDLALGWFIPLLAAAVVLSWLSTPKETILQAAYFVEQSETIADQVSFAAAYMVSYIMLLVLAIDVERTILAGRQLIKFGMLSAAVLFVVVDLQLLRGNRESSGLLVGLFGLCVTGPFLRAADWKKAKRAAWRRTRWALLPMVLLAGVFISLGQVRGTATDLSARLGWRETFLLGLSQNTWTAVLWTNLSTAYMYRTGMLHWRYGQTYVDYVLSLPPGFVTNAFGIERPATSHNLAAEDPAGVTAGGLDVVVTPFKNFGAPGTLLIMMGIGFFIAWVEWHHARGSLGGRVLYASVLCGSFQWFWYGDLAFIRALLSAALVYLIYRILLWISPTHPAVAASFIERHV
jgi:hypothetical protein